MKPTLIETGKKAEIVCGSASVRLTTTKNGKYFQHILRWTIGSRSFRRVFADRKKAIAEGERIARNLASADGERTTVSTDDLVYFRECAKKLRPHSMHEAVDFFLKFHVNKSGAESVAEIADAYVADVSSRKDELSKRYPKTVKYEVDIWKRWVGTSPIQSLTAERVREVLKLSGFSKTSKRNLVRRFQAIENFAKRKGHLTEGYRSLVAEISIPKELKPPLVFTPEELMRLLIVLDKRDLAYVTTMAFGASRRSEYEQMTKAHLDFEDDQARIDETIAKGKSRRTLDKIDTLKLWLALADADIPEAGSLISKKAVERVSGNKARLKQVGLVWKNNALRHSFCSYHLAKHRDATETSLLAGNSPAIIFSNYNAVVSKKAAIEWFNITPDVVRAYAFEKRLTHLITW